MPTPDTMPLPTAEQETSLLKRPEVIKTLGEMNAALDKLKELQSAPHLDDNQKRNLQNDIKSTTDSITSDHDALTRLEETKADRKPAAVELNLDEQLFYIRQHTMLIMQLADTYTPEFMEKKQARIKAEEQAGQKKFSETARRVNREMGLVNPEDET